MLLVQLQMTPENPTSCSAPVNFQDGMAPSTGEPPPTTPVALPSAISHAVDGVAQHRRLPDHRLGQHLTLQLPVLLQLGDVALQGINAAAQDLWEGLTGGIRLWHKIVRVTGKLGMKTCNEA